MGKELLGNSKLNPATPRLSVFTMTAGLLVSKASVELVRGKWDRDRVCENITEVAVFTKDSSMCLK